MRNMLLSLATIVCLYAPASFAGIVYSINPSQSYVSVSVPTWERGDPWNRIATDGSSVGGYEWRPTTRSERFGISGGLELSIMSGLWNDGQIGIQTELRDLTSSAPSELGFAIPSYLWYDPTLGVVSSRGTCNGFGNGSIFCYADFSRTAGGTLVGNDLILDGLFGPPTIIYIGMFGGLEAPPDPEFSYANAPYSYHIEATIPEPATVSLLLMALFLVVVGHQLGSSEWRQRRS